MVNRYSTTFFSRCPNNDIRITYRLTIETESVIQVEDILAAVEATSTGFHEDIADDLLRRLGGKQTLVAEHHGVVIETERSK